MHIFTNNIMAKYPGNKGLFLFYFVGRSFWIIISGLVNKHIRNTTVKATSINKKRGEEKTK